MSSASEEAAEDADASRRRADREDPRKPGAADSKEKRPPGGAGGRGKNKTLAQRIWLKKQMHTMLLERLRPDSGEEDASGPGGGRDQRLTAKERTASQGLTSSSSRSDVSLSSSQRWDRIEERHRREEEAKKRNKTSYNLYNKKRLQRNIPSQHSKKIPRAQPSPTNGEQSKNGAQIQRLGPHKLQNLRGVHAMGTLWRRASHAIRANSLCGETEPTKQESNCAESSQKQFDELHTRQETGHSKTPSGQQKELRSAVSQASNERPGDGQSAAEKDHAQPTREQRPSKIRELQAATASKGNTSSPPGLRRVSNSPSTQRDGSQAEDLGGS